MDDLRRNAWAPGLSPARPVPHIRGGWNHAAANGLRALIARTVTDEVLEEIAEEHRGGRRLLVSTTNLDATRPVIWRIATMAY